MTTRNDEIKQQWWVFHKRHPEVWKMFLRFTFDMINAGYKNGSSMMVIQRIRWETGIVENRGADFKVNNNFAPWYARLFMHYYPEHDGFFRTRRMASQDAPATNLPPLMPADFD
jgi:hypothetical protein